MKVSLGFKLIIFTVIHENIASKYYYNKINGTYDVYYGPRAIRDYKEFKSPKSYKPCFVKRADRPGRCNNGNFICKEPYAADQTEVFKCKVDYQCPRYFKCCQPNCFLHRVCQPADIEVDCNEILALSPTPIETFTVITQSIETANTTAVPLSTVPSSSSSTSTTTYRMITPAIPHTTVLETKTSYKLSESESYPTESNFTPSTTPLHTNTLPSKEETKIANVTRNDKYTASSGGYELTSRSISIASHESTTIALTETTRSVISTMVPIQNKTEITDVTSDDEDMTFSGDYEITSNDITTVSHESMNSTITQTTKIASSPITTEAFLPTVSITYSKSNVTTKFEKTSTAEQLLTTVVDLSPLPPENLLQTTKYLHTTTFETILTEKSSMPYFNKSAETTTQVPLETTKILAVVSTDKTVVSVPSTLPPKENKTEITDVTSDDEDLTFSGDNELILIDISTVPHESSAVTLTETTKAVISPVTTAFSAESVAATTLTTAISNTSAKEFEKLSTVEPMSFVSSYTSSQPLTTELSNTSAKEFEKVSTVEPTSFVSPDTSLGQFFTTLGIPRLTATSLANTTVRSDGTSVARTTLFETPSTPYDDKFSKLTARVLLETTKSFEVTSTDKTVAFVTSTLPPKQKETEITDVTSDDEDLTFSGDHELTLSNVTTLPDKYSTIILTGTANLVPSPAVARSTEAFMPIVLTTKSSNIAKVTTDFKKISTVEPTSLVSSVTNLEQLSTALESSPVTPVNLVNATKRLDGTSTVKTILFIRSTSSPKERFTVVTDTTSDDEDLVFSGDYEIIGNTSSTKLPIEPR